MAVVAEVGMDTRMQDRINADFLIRKLGLNEDRAKEPKMASTREELVADLAKSRASSYKDMDVAKAELQQKYFV